MKVEQKILLIVNEFPPVGESGVQRALKFLKYLSREKWQTYVITTGKPSKNILDPSLLEEIPADTKVFRTHSLGLTGTAVGQVENLRFQVEKRVNPIKNGVWKVLKFINDLMFPLDKQIGWVPFAFVKAVYLIKRYGIRNVYITAYPFSSFLIGIFLKKVFGNRIFWVADYRDAWKYEPLISQNVYPWRQKIMGYWDTQTLRICDHAIFVTDHIREQYCAEYEWVRNKSCVITNGYDEDDFLQVQPVQFDRFTFLLMGKIYGFKGSPMTLLQALQSASLDNFQFVHIGTVPTHILEEIKQNHYDFYRYAGYKPHTEALNMAAGADISVIILNDDPESVGVLTGKLFELLRIGKPILVVGPRESAIQELIKKENVGRCAYIGDVQDIREAILDLVNHPESYQSNKQDISNFSREYLTKQLISIYESTV